MRKLLLGLIGLLFAVPAVATDLPAGYTELQYIESTGTQYIDTGLYGNLNTEAEIDVHLNETSDATGNRIFGNYTNTEKAITINGANSADAKSRFGNMYQTLNIYSSERSVYKINKTNLTRNGVVLVTFDATTPFTTEGTLLLGTTGTSTVGVIGKIYSAIFRESGNTVMSFVPAKNSSGVVGMYDTVSGTFFTNAGTGTFTGGPVVVDSCRNLFDSTPYKTGYYINESGVEQSADAEQYIIRQAVVQPGTQYTLSFVVTQAGYTQRYHAYDANGNWLSQVAAVGGSEVVGTKVIKTFTTPANTKYIRQGGRSQSEYQLELGDTATEYVPFCSNPIKIATTAYNSARFSPVVTELNDTIATIRDVVTNTINQTKAIADLQATKQTRPDENCPAGKKCLLVEDNDGTPHWYEIIENVYDLPSGYTALEYIESTGTQYIDTGLKGNLNTKVEIDMQIPEYTSSHVGYFMGSRTAQNNDAFLIGSSDASLSQNGKYFAQFDSVTPSSVTEPKFDLNRHVLSLSSSGFYVDNQLYISYSNPQSFTTQENIPLFARYSAGTLANGAFRVFSFKMYNNSTLVRNLIPAKNSSNVIGMYDTVNDVFYTNQGTGTFTAGPEI